MNATQALAWMKNWAIALESARPSIPRLAQVIAGGPLRGSWWSLHFAIECRTKSCERRGGIKRQLHSYLQGSGGDTLLVHLAPEHFVLLYDLKITKRCGPRNSTRRALTASRKIPLALRLPQVP